MKPELGDVRAMAWAYEYGLPALKDPPLRMKVPVGSGDARDIEFGVEARLRDRDLRFEVPKLGDMDELHVVRAELHVKATQGAQTPVSASAPSGKAKVLALPDGDPRVGGLEQVLITGLVIEGAPPTGWALRSTTRSVQWRGAAAPEDGFPDDCKPLRLLARLPKGTGFGPPIAAAPAFAMPGDPGKLYGDALAGAKLKLSLIDGRVDALLTFDPPLESRKVELRIAVLPDADALPNQAAPISWRADKIDATWATGLRGLEIAASVPGLPELDPAPVASFPGLTEGKVTVIDFSAAARSLLRTAYRDAAAPTLVLRMKSASTGRLAIVERVVEAEYRRRLVDETGVTIALRGGLERATFAIPHKLKPARFTMTFDGRFGPHALITSADAGELPAATPRSGYRIAGGLAVARWLPLTVDEAARRLTRVSVEGRGAGECELLLALHRGDPLHIGARHGDPVALAVPGETTSRWHRAELVAAAAAPPHPGGVWVVAQVSRGSFWWAAAFGDAGASCCQRSPDAGGTWDARPGRPRAQVHQEWLDTTTQTPIPADIACTWQHGLLRTDIRPIDQLAAPTFRGVGVALLGKRDLPGDGKAPLDRVAALGVTLALGFECRRDVDFRVLDAVMTYNPWLSPG